MGPIGGIILGLLCTYFINKFSNIKLLKIFAFLNGIPILIIILILFFIFFLFFYLLLYIFIIYLLINIHYLICSNNYFNIFFDNFFSLLLSPLGFYTIIDSIFNLNEINLSSFIIYFMRICENYKFNYILVIDKWNNSYIQNIWHYLNNLDVKNSLQINQWILLLPFDQLPINNSNQMVNIFDWFHQSSIGNNYSVIFGFFTAFGVMLFLTAKKENRKPTIFIVSFILLMVLLTGKTYALSLMILFVSPLLYFGLYLPVTLLNYALINLLNIHLFSLLGTGLIDFIAFGIIPSAKGTNFGWVFLFSFIWFCVSFPILYWVTVKKNLPFIGRTETIIPRLTHRQIHDMFNC